MSTRTRYASPVSRPFGTKELDPLRPGRFLPGEVNQDGQPMGTPRPAGPSALDTFQAGKSTPALTAFKARQTAPAPAVGARTGTPLPVPVMAQGAKDEFGRPTMAPAQPAAPAAAPVPRWSAPALPSHPDDRALLMATRTADAAARAPETPRPIPAGDPAARAFFGKRSTPEPIAAAPVAPRAVAPGTPDLATLAIAGTGRTAMTPFGAISSTVANPNVAQSPAVWSNTGVVHPQATPAGVTASAQVRHDAGPSPFTPGLAPTGTMANTDSSTMGFPKGPALASAPRVTPPVPQGVTDFPPPGVPGGRFGGTGETPLPGRPVLEPVQRPFRPDLIPTASSSHPPTQASLDFQDTHPPADTYKEPGWRLPWASAPVPDFPPAGAPGGRLGGTGGIDAPTLPRPFLPKKKATPIMDKIADGYGG